MSRLELQEAFSLCPYCSERISILMDTSIETQDYIEDCEVCCRPISVKLNWIDDDNFELNFYQENDVS